MPCKDCHDEALCDRMGLCQVFAKEQLQCPTTTPTSKRAAPSADTGVTLATATCGAPAAATSARSTIKGTQATAANKDATALDSSSRSDASGVPVVDDGQEWEQAARGVVANPRPIEEIKRDIADVMKRVDEAAAGVLESDAALHTFLNAAAGEGLVLDGVDAADLYIATFPEHYRATVASIEGDSSGVMASPMGSVPCPDEARRTRGVLLPSQAALDSPSVQMPQGFTPEERRAFILGVAAAGKAGVEGRTK